MISIFSKNRYIYCWIHGDLFFLETTQKRQSEIGIFYKTTYIFVNLSLLNRYISEKPKGRANKSKERAKRRVGKAPAMVRIVFSSLSDVSSLVNCGKLSQIISIDCLSHGHSIDAYFRIKFFGFRSKLKVDRTIEGMPLQL